MSERYDFAVVGGGFYGARLALLLSKWRARVLLIEREPEICRRASYNNQARVHNGYHYLRSYSTALGSHQHYDRFRNNMTGCTFTGFEHIYGISRHGSHTNAYQFLSFCRQLGLPVKRAPKSVHQLFDTSEIEDLFIVEECVFDANAVRARLRKQLAEADGLDLKTSTICTRINAGAGSLELATSDGCFEAKGAFIVCYAGLNGLLRRSGLAPLPLKGEVAEVCLVDAPPTLRSLGITIMDGQFFSLIPMPAERCHSLTHVRYTPHASVDLKKDDAENAFQQNGEPSRYIYMRKHAQKFCNEVSRVRHRRSLFEVKVVPKKREIDDGRPIIFHKHIDDPLCVSVLGAKIDSIYELEDAVGEYLAARRPS